MRDETHPFPWRPLTALLLALAAQTLLEPPANALAALALYLLAFALALWSSARNEWTLPSPPPTPPAYPLSSNSYPLSRLLPLAASLPLLSAAFYFFGGNQFTPLNLS
ncbi:MAG: hypothetical protein AB1750_04140, partial [Chloroflexota bacterium]